MQQSPSYSAPNNSDIKVSPLVGMSVRDLIMSVLTGMGAGLLTSGVYLLINKYVFSAVLCRPEAVGSDCVNAPLYAAIVGLIIGAIAALVALAQLRMFRPLLAVIAASVALWGFHVITAPLAWYWEIVASMVLFGLVYGIFLWVARIRSFVAAVVLTVVLVVAIRLMLIA